MAATSPLSIRLLRSLPLLLVCLLARPSAPALAAGGDVSLDFTAAAPLTYDHVTGGGAYNDRTVGDTDDIVESLQGGEFMCGDTVTYLTEIEIDGSPANANQTIEIDFAFLADTTGQPGAALSDIRSVSINYGSVQNGAGPGGTDSGISDDAGSSASLISESLTGPLFASGSRLLGTVRVTDLEASERVILRVDVRLACDPGSNPTGNLHARLGAARIVSPIMQSISGGAQTIPFQQTGDIVFPDLQILKTVTTENGACPGVDELEVRSGDTVKYCYEVANGGNAPLLNVTLVDDAGTPGNALDDFPLTLVGLTDADGDMQSDDLVPGATATASITKLMGLPAGTTLTNVATASGDQVPPTTDDATVVVTRPPEGGCGIAVTASTNGACPGVEVVTVLAGTPVTWCYEVFNSTAFDLNSVQITDDGFGAIGTIPQLGPVSSSTLTRLNDEFADAVHKGSASGTDPFGNVRDCLMDTAAVNVVAPGLTIDKTVRTNGQCPGQDSIQIVIGTAVKYCFKISNTGDTAVQNISVTDDIYGPIGNIAQLGPGQMQTLTFGPTQPTHDVTNVGTVRGRDEFGFPLMDEDTAIVDVLAADVRLLKDGPALVNRQETDQLVYTLEVTNLGELTAEDVVVSDPLPAGLVFVDAVSTKGTCGFDGTSVICMLGDLAPQEVVTITIEATVTIRFGMLHNTACAATDSPESDLDNNCDDHTTRVAPGATRTIGFYKNHHDFVRQCLDVNQGVIQLGFVTLRDEAFDNEIDSTEGGDVDTQVETGHEMAMGVLNANVTNFVDGKKRSRLLQARMIAGRQVLAGICNETLLGSDSGIDIDAAIATLAGNNVQAILAIGSIFDEFNNAGDILPLGVNPGPADPFFPWDDPTDKKD